MKRSFTYITDVVGSLVTLIETKPTGKSEIYNLGGSEVISLKHFVALIEKRLGKKAKKLLSPLQPGDVAEVVADCSKAKRDFGYTPRVSMEEGTAAFIDWFLTHKTFLLALKEPKK